MKKGLLQTLMTRGIGHTRFKKTEIGEIPEEWEVVPMGTLGIVQGGRQRSPGRRGSPRPYLRVANVFHGHIDTSDVLTMPFTDSEFETYRLREGDILLNEGQSLNLVGRSATYRGQPPDCCFQNTLIRFRAGGRITVSFAQELLHQLWYVGRLAEIATQTTSVAHLGLKRFAALKVAVPPLAEQARIAGVLAGFDLEPSSGSLASLQTLKRGLLQDLLTGRVRVTPA